MGFPFAPSRTGARGSSSRQTRHVLKLYFRTVRIFEWLSLSCPIQHCLYFYQEFHVSLTHGNAFLKLKFIISDLGWVLKEAFEWTVSRTAMVHCLRSSTPTPAPINSNVISSSSAVTRRWHRHNNTGAKLFLFRTFRWLCQTGRLKSLYVDLPG